MFAGKLDLLSVSPRFDVGEDQRRNRVGRGRGEGTSAWGERDENDGGESEREKSRVGSQSKT